MRVRINKLRLYLEGVGAGFRLGSFLAILNFMFMKISKIKSFVFGLAFLGSMAFGGISVNAQRTSEERSVCCQKTGAFCTDRFGTPYGDSIESPGATCGYSAL